jgi:hypothetical protein
MSTVKIILTYVAAVGGAVVAGLATLPYQWARITAASLGAAMAVLSASIGTVATVQNRKAATTPSKPPVA